MIILVTGVGSVAMGEIAKAMFRRTSSAVRLQPMTVNRTQRLTLGECNELSATSRITDPVTWCLESLRKRPLHPRSLEDET